MLDESQLGVSLWLRSVGLRNPLDDDTSEGSEQSRGSRGSAGTTSRTTTTTRGTLNVGSGDGHNGVDDYYLNTNDVMVPPADAESRKGTIFTSSTALALTLAGSCAVDAPYAFHKCGLLWGTLLFGILAVATERSLHMLCSCARKTGSNSYGTLTRSACGGYRAHWKTNALEISVLLLLLGHYLNLLRRVLALWLQSFQDTDTPSFSENWVLLICAIVIILPLSIPKQYSTVGPVWVLGLGSMSLFGVLVGALAVIHYYQIDGDHQQVSNLVDSLAASRDQDRRQDQLDLFGQFTSSRTLWDVIEGFQTLLIGFLASFNVLPIQSSLEDPTRERMATVVHKGVLMGALLTYTVGVVGYLCVGTHTASSPRPDADFLECIQYHANNSQDTPYLLIYRICHSSCSLAIILALPLILTPCRHCILELIESIYSERQCPEITDCQEDCETCSTRASTVGSDNTPNRSNALVVVDERTGEVINESSNLLPSIEENPTYDLLSNPLAQGLCTLGILIWAYLCAVVATLMDDFYLWVGPCMVYVFAFMMPSLHFFALQRPRRPTSTDPEKKSFRLCARIFVFLCFGGIVFSIVDIVHNLPKGRMGHG